MEIDAAWAAARQATSRKHKKLPYLYRPKRSLKPKVYWQEPSGSITEPSMLVEDAAEDEGVEGVDSEEELVDFMRALNMEHFVQVSTLAETLLFCCYRTSLSNIDFAWT